MKTVEDLGRKVKKKYPQYRHLSDLEAGRQVKADFPDAYHQYQEVSMTYTPPQPPTPPVKLNPLDSALEKITPPAMDLGVDLSHLFDLYKPNRGKFTSWLHNRKFESRLKLLGNAGLEMQALIQQGAVIEDAIRNKQQKEIAWKQFLATNALLLLQIHAEAQLLENATNEGQTLEKHQEFVGKKKDAELRVLEEREFSDIRITEHDRMTQIDLDRKIQEAETTVRLGIVNEYLKEHQKIMMIHDLIDQNYKQINQLHKDKELTPGVRDLMIAERMSSIEAFRKDMNARQTRLLQENHRQES